MHTGRILLQSLLWRGLYYVAAFIINILIAHHFQASTSGAVYYISSIYALVLLLVSLSLESGIIYFAAKHEIPVVRLFNFSIFWSFAFGLITFLFVYNFNPKPFLGIPANLIIGSSVLFITGNLLITFCSGFFYAANNFFVPNIIIISGTLILIIIIPYNGHSVLPAVTDENYFYIYFASFFVQGLCMAVAAKFNFIKAWSFQLLSLTQFRVLFRYCALAFIGNVIFFLLYRVDYYFVEKYCTSDQLGNYIQVSKLVHLFFILPTILASVVFPVTAGGKMFNFNGILPLLSRVIFVTYLIVCFLLVLTGKWIFPLVFGESFIAMYQPFLWMIPGILALSGIFTLTAYFAGKNRIKVNIIGSVYALIIIVAGDVILIPKYGINAAAMMSSIGYVVYQIYIILVFKKEYQHSLSDFFIFKVSDWIQVKKIYLGGINRSNEAQQ